MLASLREGVLVGKLCGVIAAGWRRVCLGGWACADREPPVPGPLLPVLGSWLARVEPLTWWLSGKVCLRGWWGLRLLRSNNSRESWSLSRMSLS